MRMRKRIDTLMYDTGTAKKLGSYASDFSPNDAKYYHEDLYKKRTGEYFLAGQGNPLSKYGRYSELTHANIKSEDIIPITYEQAQKWYEKANNDNSLEAPDAVYEKEFGGNSKVATTMILSREAKRKLEEMAIKTGISQRDVVEKLIMNS